MTERLIVGLGNVGREYEQTWHNLGFIMLDSLAKEYSVSLTTVKFKGFFAKVRQGDKQLYFLKPATYMNNSGEAVRACLDYLKLDPKQLLVLYDDFELPFLDLRYREKGGAGTHNGMKSIVQHLKTDDFPRLRIGAGPIPEQYSIVDFVLSKIPQQKLPDLDNLARRINTFVKDLDGFNSKQAVNVLHGQNASTLAKLREREARLSAQKEQAELKKEAVLMANEKSDVNESGHSNN